MHAMKTAAEWFLRLALAAAFLSAVADRLGLWGPPGTAGVAWGSWAPFVTYTGHLNWFVPAVLVAPLAVLATLLEMVAAVGLLLGWQLRRMALLAGLLLLSFGVTMVVADGLKGPLDYSVFTAAAAGLYLYSRPGGSRAGGR